MLMRFMEPGNVHFGQAVQVILAQVGCKPHFEKLLIIIGKGKEKDGGMEGQEHL